MAEAYPHTREQRCWVHTAANVLAPPCDTSGALRKAEERLKVDEAAGEFHHPDQRLVDQIEELVDAC